MLMGKTLQHAVLVFMYAQRRARERGERRQRENEKQYECGGACVWGVRLYIPPGQRAVCHY